jgi:serine/threonine-protein kinase
LLGDARPDAPCGLATVIERCLEKDPAKRYQNVAELAIALLPFGPRRARVPAERSTSVIRAAGLSSPDLKFPSSVFPPADTQSGSAVSLSAPALTTSRRTSKESITLAGPISGDERPRSRAPLVAAVIIALVVGLGATALTVTRSRSAEKVDRESFGASAPSAASELAITATPAVTPGDPASGAAAASAGASATPAVSPPPATSQAALPIRGSSSPAVGRGPAATSASGHASLATAPAARKAAPPGVAKGATAAVPKAATEPDIGY